MDIIVYSISLICLAGLVALFEIQIEGANGWASQLPTWRTKTGLTDRLLCGRPLTGYHLFLILTVLAFLHLQFISAHWDWRAEVKTLGFFILLMTIEDWLWFVFNPAWGLRSFKKSEQLWWHPRWFLGLPDFYWISLPVGILAALWGFGYL